MRKDFTVEVNNLEEFKIVLNYISKHDDVEKSHFEWKPKSYPYYVGYRESIWDGWFYNSTCDDGSYFPKISFNEFSRDILKENKYEKGKWYAYNGWYIKYDHTDCDTIFISSEEINMDQLYEKCIRSFGNVREERRLITDLAEISPYLPEGHPDKITGGHHDKVESKDYQFLIDDPKFWSMSIKKLDNYIDFECSYYVYNNIPGDDVKMKAKFIREQHNKKNMLSDDGGVDKDFQQQFPLLPKDCFEENNIVKLKSKNKKKAIKVLDV